MRTRFSLAIAAVVFAVALVGNLRAAAPLQQSQAPGAGASRPGGWTIPPDADKETNPVAGDPQAIAAGKQLFQKNCQRCHGPAGKGDGPDGDPDHQEDMDLTVARRASRNPDGVIFYKAWNGRTRPKMPAFKDTLSKDQVWQIVSFVQTLRQKE